MEDIDEGETEPYITDAAEREKDEAAAPPIGTLYWVSISKKGFRRLRRINGCQTPKDSC